MFRFIHFSDTHLGDHFPDNRKANLDDYRGKDYFENYFRIIDFILHNHKNIDFIIHTGDFFDSDDPSLFVQELALKPLQKIDKLGIPFFLLKGNHERTGIPKIFYNSIKNLIVFNSPQFKKIEIGKAKITITGIPYLKKKEGKLSALFKRTLEETKIEENRGDFNILMAHQLLEGAAVGPDGYRFRPYSKVLTQAAIPDFFDYVSVGHIHRHQVVRNKYTRKNNIFISGSQEMITFSEIGERKGFYYVTVSDNRRINAKFISLPVRPMFEFTLDLANKSRKELLKLMNETIDRIPENGYGKIRLDGKIPKAFFKELPLDKCRKKAYKCHFSFKHLKIIGDDSNIIILPDHDNKGMKGLLLNLDITSSKLRKIPKEAGIYFYKDKEDKVIYIGRSKNIYRTIQNNIKNSIFSLSHRELLEKIHTIEYQFEENELFAILDEIGLKKQFRPIYNRKILFSKEYSYLTLKIKNGLPYFSIISSVNGNEKHLLGPLINGNELERTVLILKNKLNFPTCDGNFYNSPNQCIKYVSNKCIAPCKSKKSARRYRKLFYDFFTSPLFILEKIVSRTNESKVGRIKELIKQITEIKKILALNGIYTMKNYEEINSTLLILKKGRIMHSESIKEPKISEANIQRYKKLLNSYNVPKFLTPKEFEDGLILLKNIENKNLISIFAKFQKHIGFYL